MTDPNTLISKESEGTYTFGELEAALRGAHITRNFECNMAEKWYRTELPYNNEKIVRIDSLVRGFFNKKLSPQEETELYSRENHPHAQHVSLLKRTMQIIVPPMMKVQICPQHQDHSEGGIWHSGNMPRHIHNIMDFYYTTRPQ